MSYSQGVHNRQMIDDAVNQDVQVGMEQTEETSIGYYVNPNSVYDEVTY